MNREELLTMLEAHLPRCKVPFSRGDLMEFVSSCGPVEDPVNVDRWCQEFLRSPMTGNAEGSAPIDMARIDAGA